MAAQSTSPRPLPATTDSEGDERLRVFVFTRDPVSQAGISSQLRRFDDISVVNESGIDTAHVAIVAADQIDAEVVHVVRAVQRNECPRVVVIATTLDAAGVMAAVEAGACAFLRRCEAVADRLLSTIKMAATSDGSVPPQLLGTMLDEIGRLQQAVLGPGTYTVLTRRELDVLHLVAEGYDTAEIADRLAYSERTIKNIIHRVVSRLGLRNRCHAVAYAMRQGLL
jgi:DNA-binding NarL/FixJ family response regulator